MLVSYQLPERVTHQQLAGNDSDLVGSGSIDSILVLLSYFSDNLA